MTPQRAIREVIATNCPDMPAEMATIISEVALHASEEAMNALTRITGAASPEVSVLSLITAMQVLKGVLESDLQKARAMFDKVD